MRSAVLLAAVLVLSGCGTREAGMPMPRMAEKSYQSIHVSTPGVTGALCRLDTAGASYSLSAPGSVTVERTPRPMSVTCRKGAHFAGSATLQPRKTMEEGDAEASMYPFSVAVPMGINNASFERRLTVY